MLRATRSILILLIIALAVWRVLSLLIDHIHPRGSYERDLPDLMAVAAAVEYFKQTHGRLPSPEEFGDLHPAPGFKVPFRIRMGTRFSFAKPEQRARDVTDQFKQPFSYEPAPDQRWFIIRSPGRDGVWRNEDDYIYKRDLP